MKEILTYPIIAIMLPLILLVYAVLFLLWLVLCLWDICWGTPCDSFKSFTRDGWYL